MKIPPVPWVSLLIVTLATTGSTLPAADRPLSPTEQRTREIYRELIEIDTTTATDKAAQAMAVRLRAAGFTDVRVLGPTPQKANVVARLRGTGARRPLLLLAHLDVVAARREDWSVDPFVLLEKDGYFYGRGTTDDKAMAAIFVANLIRFQEEKFVPNRDLIVALTADEEGGDHNGVDWLLQYQRDLIDAELALNEGGSGGLRKGKRIGNSLQASEKVYLSFRLEVRNKGGHSSLPRPDNAIYQLARALVRISEFEFPVQLSEVTRSFFEKVATIEEPETAAAIRAILRDPTDAQAAARLRTSPEYHARLRTTAIATLLEGGHAENALPQKATAVVNCRLLPEASPDEVEATLRKVIADDAVVLTRLEEPSLSPASPLTPEILRAVEGTTEALWPGVPVIPVMSTGATDGARLRRAGIPTYGVSGLFMDMDDMRMHGRDERLGVQEFYEGTEFLYRLVKTLASNP